MTKIDNVLKYLGIIWSALAVIVGAAVFFGGHWQDWIRIRQAFLDGEISSPDLADYAKKSELPTVPSNLLTVDVLGTAAEAAGFIRFGMPLNIRSVGSEEIGLMRNGHSVNALPETTRTDATWAWTLSKK